MSNQEFKAVKRSHSFGLFLLCEGPAGDRSGRFYSKATGKEVLRYWAKSRTFLSSHQDARGTAATWDDALQAAAGFAGSAVLSS